MQTERFEGPPGLTGNARLDDSRLPSAASRLARQFEILDQLKHGEQMDLLLQQILSMMGASTLLWLTRSDLGSQDSGGLTIQGCSGRCSRKLLDELEQVLLEADEEMTSLRGCASAALITARTERGSQDRSYLVALFSEPAPAWAPDVLGRISQAILETPHESSSIAHPQDPPSSLHLRLPEGMVPGGSSAIRCLFRHIEATVQSDLDVLILGETGTGKELIARMIHASGPTRHGPFVAINCAAIPTDLLEAELFGVARRAATGVDPRPGHFVQADGGTLFLDEIGELPERLQAKLLRAVQEREVHPVGSSKPARVNLRIVTASNCNVPALVERGEFRADLYYRLRGLQFHVPPLRDRTEDIPALVVSFAERAARRYGKQVKGVSRTALDLLMSHSWPGNIRELQTEVERAVLLCSSGAVLQRDHFGPIQWARENPERRSIPDLTASHDGPLSALADAPTAPDADKDFQPLEFQPLKARIEAVERRAIEEALRNTGGNKSAAARLLGITRNGLSLKMERLGLDR